MSFTYRIIRVYWLIIRCSSPLLNKPFHFSIFVREWLKRRTWCKEGEGVDFGFSYAKQECVEASFCCCNVRCEGWSWKTAANDVFLSSVESANSHWLPQKLFLFLVPLWCYFLSPQASSSSKVLHGWKGEAGLDQELNILQKKKDGFNKHLQPILAVFCISVSPYSDTVCHNCF